MLQRLTPASGQAILELAAGTGVVGFAAALVGSGGRVIVSDFSEAMVAVAERRAAELGLENVECRVLTRSGWSSLTRRSTACSAAGGTC